MTERTMLIPLAGILMPVVLVPMIILLKQSHHRRELAFRERMRAMELGLNPPSESPSPFWPSLAAIAIGAVVPLGSMIFAWLASRSNPNAEDMWPAAAGIGVTGLICGTILAARLGCSRSKSQESAPAAADHRAKPSFDPDAYDTVGSRG